jgi:glycosyltransferase involved in cell wall biosynthesis
MRILLLMDPFIPVPPEHYGGIERIVFDIATQYVKDGHQVTLVAGPNSKSPDRLIIYGKNGPLNPNINIKHLWQVYNILKKEIKDHDVIHNFGRLAFLTPFLRNEIPKVQSYLRWVSRFNIIKTDWIRPINLTYTAVSNAIKDTGVTRKSTWHTIYNCAPIDRFTFKADTRPDGYLTFIGRFERCKGLHSAIKVAKLSNRQLIIAGFISHIPIEKRYYEKEIKPLIDGVQIKWIGEVNNTQRNELLRNASALLTPVEWLEPFPVIIPEAYACGTPVLGFNRGGVPEGIEHGVTGYISTTVQEMASDVLKINKLNRQACRTKAENEYSSEKIAENYFKLYSKPKTYFHNPLKMKILLLMDPGIPVPPPLYGGHERLVSSFANEYKRQGHDVTLLAGPESHFAGKTITYGVNDLKRSQIQKFKEIFFVWRYLRKNKFDLIHNFGRLVYLLPVLNRDTNKIMSYGRKIAPSGIKIMNSLPNKNIIYTGCSNYCVSSGNVAGNWKTIYNAIDFNNYKLQEQVKDDAPLIFLSRLDKIKGPHIAIQIALKTGNKLILAGNMPTTPDDMAYYDTLVKPHINKDQIIYVGEVNDQQKNHWLGTAKAMLFPLSGTEAFGLVMIEAMACGTPVIAFNHASAPEVIDPEVSGFIANSEDEMIQYLEKAYQINRAGCQAIAKRRFDVPVIAKQYLELFA